MLRILDLFSGIGGFSLGLERAGMRTVAFCEIDPFCRQVLAKHWPDVPCHDDVSTMQFSEGMADVVCGGFPCQDVSLAGKRAGLSGTRSGLYRELVRAIRVVRPRWAIIENVAALLSTRTEERRPAERCICGWPIGWRRVPNCSDTSECGEFRTENRHRNVGQSHGDLSCVEGTIRRVDPSLSTIDPEMGSRIKVVSSGRALRRTSTFGRPAFNLEDGTSLVAYFAGGIEEDVAEMAERPVSMDGSRGRAGEDYQGEDSFAECQRTETAGCPGCGRSLEDVATLIYRCDGMGTVLGDLAESGLDLEWDCVPANAVGAPHERDRVWIVAHANREGRPQSPLSGNEFRVRPGDCPEALSATEDASDASREQVGPTRQSRIDGGLVPTDSFARIRREAERTRADPYGARLAFRQGFTGNAWEELSTAQRNAIEDERQSIWPHEPALSGMDDGIPDWMDRVKATGNAVVPQIPEAIGRAIIDGESRC